MSCPLSRGQLACKMAPGLQRRRVYFAVRAARIPGPWTRVDGWQTDRGAVFVYKSRIREFRPDFRATIGPGDTPHARSASYFPHARSASTTHLSESNGVETRTTSRTANPASRNSCSRSARDTRDSGVRPKPNFPKVCVRT